MQSDRVLHSAPKSTSHSHVRFGSMKGFSSQFAEKRPGKVFNFTLKTGIFPGRNSRKSGCPDSWRF